MGVCEGGEVVDEGGGGWGGAGGGYGWVARGDDAEELREGGSSCHCLLLLWRSWRRRRGWIGSLESGWSMVVVFELGRGDLGTSGLIRGGEDLS